MSFRKSCTQAEPLYQRALAIREQVFGPDHPNTATSLSYLAALFESQEKYEQAGLFYRRALDIRERTLGSTHPNTISSQINYQMLIQKVNSKRP